MFELKEFEGRGARGSKFVEDLRRSLKGRGYDDSFLEELIVLIENRKNSLARFEKLRAHQKKLGEELTAKEISTEKKEGLKKILKDLAPQVKEAEQQVKNFEQKIFPMLEEIPNIVSMDTPEGQSSADNQEIKKGKTTQRVFPFSPKPHFELGNPESYIDFERGAKVSGSRFNFLVGEIALLERALINFFLDTHTKRHGYREIIPPYVVNAESYRGTGQFPKFILDVFSVSHDKGYLISTAEVPVTNYFRGEILKEEELPILFCAFSPCFRAEAGAHGKDTKGLTRLHQFHKVELVIFAKPEESRELHEQLTSHAEYCLEALELPYRRVLLCTGDIGFSASKCYDLEVWIPSERHYREISSCSNFEDFQAKRANIRYRESGSGALRFLHTLNGSGLAIGRTVMAILENYQNEDGSVTVPKILQSYLQKDKILKP